MEQVGLTLRHRCYGQVSYSWPCLRGISGTTAKAKKRKERKGKKKEYNKQRCCYGLYIQKTLFPVQPESSRRRLSLGPKSLLGQGLLSPGDLCLRPSNIIVSFSMHCSEEHDVSIFRHPLEMFTACRDRLFHRDAVQLLIQQEKTMNEMSIAGVGRPDALEQRVVHMYPLAIATPHFRELDKSFPNASLCHKWKETK